MEYERLVCISSDARDIVFAGNARAETYKQTNSTEGPEKPFSYLDRNAAVAYYHFAKSVLKQSRGILVKTKPFH